GPSRHEPVVMTGSRTVAGILVDALRPRVAAVRAGRDVVGLAGARVVARVGRVALAGRRVTAGGPGRLEPVVRTGARAGAGILVHALRPGIATVRSSGDMVRLADARAVACVGVVALAQRRIAAGGPSRLEAVVRARAR